jgi:hypothetical protein
MNKFSALLFSVAFSLTAFASEQKPVVALPPGWKCADKTTPDGQKYQICSPPAGQQGNPFFVWTREPKSK